MWGEGKVEEWEGREEELGLVCQKGEVGKKTIQNKQEIILVVFEKGKRSSHNGYRWLIKSYSLI